MLSVDTHATAGIHHGHALDGRRGARMPCLRRLFPVLIALTLASLAAAQDAIYLEQNWSPQRREEFYFTPQGSRLMPYDWFLALERGDDKELFASPANLARFGWVYHSQVSDLNPGRLPIGMTLEPADAPGGGKWLGMTCAACHTGNVTHAGKVVRVDGAPAMSDFGAFLRALSNAVLL